jgi:endonuclease G
MANTNQNGKEIQFTIPLQISISLGKNILLTADELKEDNLETFRATDTSGLEAAITIDQHYGNRKGFDENFIEGAKLPKLTVEQENLAATVVGSDSYLLKYHHFSIVINKERKMPFFTAVNIDGAKYNKIKEQIPSRKTIGSDRWYVDPRIELDQKNPTNQLPTDFYRGNDFDIGHQVRREDPIWGENAEFALKCNNDTFHLTNACPQHRIFNQGINDKTDPNYKNVVGKILWQGLENYILDNSRRFELLVNVYTGPVFSDTDKNFKGTEVKIPEAFWKVVVMPKENGELSATGYVVSQGKYIENMLEEFTFQTFLFYQVAVKHVEKLTGLSFNLSKYDPLEREAVEVNEGFSFEELEHKYAPLETLEQIKL